MEISIEGVVSKKLGLVSHQNAVPLLRQLIVSSGDPRDLRDLVLTLEPSLPFASPKIWHIDSLTASAAVQVSDRDLELKELSIPRIFEPSEPHLKEGLNTDGTVW